MNFEDEFSNSSKGSKSDKIIDVYVPGDAESDKEKNKHIEKDKTKKNKDQH